MNPTGVMAIGGVYVSLVLHTPQFPQVGETTMGDLVASEIGGSGANQAKGIGRLEGKVRLVARVGGDALGQDLLRRLRTNKVDTGSVMVDPSLISGMALTLLGEPGSAARVVVPGANPSLTGEDVLAALDEGAPAVVLITADTPSEAIQNAITSVPAETVILFSAPSLAEVDLKPELRNRINYLVLDGANSLLPETMDPEAVLINLAKTAQAEGFAHVLVSSISDGAGFAGQGETRHFSGLPLPVLDPTVSFDAFVAALGHFLSERRTVVSATYLANACRALASSHFGGSATFPTLRDLQTEVPHLLTA